MKFKKLSIIMIAISTLLPFGVASALGTSDNYILEHELFDEKCNMSIVSAEIPVLAQDISETDIFVPWEDLASYIDEKETKHLPNTRY